MCNRYSISKREATLQSRSGLIQAELVPRYNIAPTQMAPVARLVEGALRLEEMRWGLEAFSGQPVTNARCETAPEKPLFREAWRERRCLVPCDGFYEWKDSPEGKQPYRFVQRARDLFWFAGLWEEDRFTILTGPARGCTTDFHDRMPLILAPGAVDWWLGAEPAAPEDLLGRCAPAELLEAYPVTPRMSNSRYTGPDCIEPFRPPQQELSLS